MPAKAVSKEQRAASRAAKGGSSARNTLTRGYGRRFQAEGRLGGCSKVTSHGVDGSRRRRREFCVQHAVEGMGHIGKKTCGSNDCSKKPTYGVDGSSRADFCAQKAVKGMAIVGSKTCSRDGCLKITSHGLEGGRKPGVLRPARREPMHFSRPFWPV